MTFAKWGDIYLERYAKHKKTVKKDQRYIRTLSAFFDNILLSQITRAHVEAFKESRKARFLNPEKRVGTATCDRELACLRYMPRLAVEERLLEFAPIVKLHEEQGARDWELLKEEYMRLLSTASLHLQNIIICAYETGMRAG